MTNPKITNPTKARVGFKNSNPNNTKTKIIVIAFFISHSSKFSQLNITISYYRVSLKTITRVFLTTHYLRIDASKCLFRASVSHWHLSTRKDEGRVVDSQKSDDNDQAHHCQMPLCNHVIQNCHRYLLLIHSPILQ